MELGLLVVEEREEEIHEIYVGISIKATAKAKIFKPGQNPEPSPQLQIKTMEAIIKAFTDLPKPLKIFIGGMLTLQGLAIGSWLILMVKAERQGRRNKKEKQS